MKHKNTQIDADECVKFFGMTKKNLNKIGITNLTTDKYKTLKEVLDTKEGMVACQVLQSCSVSLNSGKTDLKKGEVLVMPMGHFSQGKKRGIYKPYRKTFPEMFRRYRGEDLTNKTLLIWRTGGLGDVIITQSVVSAIKERFPSCKVIYATNPAFHESFYAWPKNLVDEVIGIPFKKEYLEKADYHLTFIHSIENCIETTNMNYFEIFQKVSCLDYDYKKYVSVLNTIPNVMKSLIPHIPPNLIIFHTKASTRLRSVNILKWKELATKLISQGKTIGIIDRRESSDEVQAFINQLGLPKECIMNLAKFSLDINYAIGMGYLAQGAICVDSAYCHIMGALRKPAVVFCGPYTSHNVCDAYPTIKGIDPENWNECNKYPCHYNNQENKCPFILSGMNPGCTDSISTDRIISVLNEVIKSNV